MCVPGVVVMQFGGGRESSSLIQSVNGAVRVQEKEREEERGSQTEGRKEGLST